MNDTKCVEPRTIGQVTANMDALNNNIERMEIAVKSLEDRLSMVLEEAPPTNTGEGCDKVAEVPLASAIDLCIGRVRIITNHINDIIGRTQL